MSRKKRRPGCSGKVRHPTQDAALHHLRTLPTTTHLNVYRCRYCGSWHVGHQPRHVRRAIEARRRRQEPWQN